MGRRPANLLLLLYCNVHRRYHVLFMQLPCPMPVETSQRSAGASRSLAHQPARRRAALAAGSSARDAVEPDRSPDYSLVAVRRAATTSIAN